MTVKARHPLLALADWIWLGAAVGVASGAASAVFLLLLDRATREREAHGLLFVYLLPIAGLAIGALYERFGASIKGGQSLIIDTLVGTDRAAPQLPLRMAPMVLVGTVLTHLFGGSAGREGTAVQMGASLADAIAHRWDTGRAIRRQLLAAGIAGGFGSVFGTPIAGTIFGLEVVCLGRMETDALAPALVAAVVGDFVTRSLGVVHTVYPTAPALGLTPLVLAKLIVLGLTCGLATFAFVELTHRLKALLERHVPRLPIRMLLGGALLVVMTKVFRTTDYLGLGVPRIVAAFGEPRAGVHVFVLKLVFTAVTIASGFLGGEVTPLFFVGATLGSSVGGALGLPVALAAGLGMAAVFGAAANTPIALSVMAVELLGGAVFPHVVVVAVVAYLATGHRGIYPAQRIFRHKHGGAPLTEPVALRDFRASLPERPASERRPPG